MTDQTADPAGDAEACAREPIHLSGAIQPHGYLVSCVLPEWTVRQVSANVRELLDVEPGELLGQGLRDLFGQELLQALADALGFVEEGAAPQRVASDNIGPFARLCDVSVHVGGGLVHLEIEPQQRAPAERAPIVVAQGMIARAAGAAGTAEFHDRVAEQVRMLTGYDRVMVYRFRHDDAGEVIAEALADGLEPYLGLRYPASDIPAQARALYLRNRLRVIPDAGYAPVPILPGRDESGQPLDLSQHALRSVAPVHVEYLRNMGVAASMSISIIAGGRLWGLIACHHRTPRLVPPTVRAAADLFGMFVSMRVAADAQDAAAAHDEAAREAREALGLRLAGGRDFAATLAAALPDLAATLRADGAGLWAGRRWQTVGRAPGTQALPALLHWARHRQAAGMSATERGVDWQAPGAPEPAVGVIGLDLGGEDWLFFFRPEEVEDVRWAGDPRKPTVPTDDGRRIAPRKSFRTWRETVRGRSEPWGPDDQRRAERLRLVLRQHHRAGEDERNVTDMEAFRRRHVLREQRARLDQLSTLLEGLVHLEDAETARLGERIADLEADLRALMHGDTLA